MESTNAGRGAPVHTPPPTEGFGDSATPQSGAALKGTDVATVAPGGAIADYVSDDAGAGFENMGLGDQIVPVLRILQTNSPQVEEGHAEQVPGARAGMLYDTATQAYFDSLMRPNAPGARGALVSICFAERGYGVWRPRDLDGGFRGMLPPNDPYVLASLRTWGTKFNFPRYRKDTGWTARGKKLDQYEKPEMKEPLKYGDEEIELIETINYYVLYGDGNEDLTADNARRAIIRFSSTSFAVAQGLNTRMNSWTYPVSVPDGQGGTKPGRRPAAIWQYRWRMRTVTQAKGNNSWYNYHFSLEPSDAKPPFDFKALIPRNDPLYDLGKDFYELSKSGGVKIQEVKSDDYHPGAEDGDGEIPF